ncbi:MAG: class I SAM-dependent methyltransferase [Thermodesulfobacteriota bacterium]|nr:class I SAM-dependent methyltransferase [Thermodesulfobacteriota bacterium]
MITIDFDCFEITPGARVLDMGCGEGRHTAAVFDQKKGFCVAADRDESALKACRQKLAFHETAAGMTCAAWAPALTDITCTGFKTSIFDIVICSEVLEHIVDHEKAMSELTRILKPGGILAVSVPRFWPEKICWLLSDAYFNVNQGHVRIYKKKELIQKIEQNGPSLFKAHYAHSLHAPFWWLKCLVGPARTDARSVSLYHRLLVWDLMKKPFVTRFFDRLFNPVLGKSLVLYFKNRL